MTKRTGQQIFLTLIFIIGGLIFTYPFYSNGINYLVDQYRMKDMTQKMADDQAKLEEKMKQSNEKLRVNGIVIEHDPFDAKQQATAPVALNNHLIGSVTIPKINMTTPLYDTITNQILENGAGVLPGTSMPTGEVGSHSVISAHRGLAERQLFRNLDKLAIGDVFVVDSLGKTYAYEVIDTKTVKPEETDIIKLQPEEDLVSLLTCTPYMINSHRLIVTGKRTEMTKVINDQVKKSEKTRQRQQIGTLVLIILGLIASLYLLYRLIKRFLLQRRRYDFTFYLRDKKNQPIIGQSFLVYRKGKKQPLRRDGQLLIPVSSEKGKVVITNLPGDVYDIALEAQPVQKLGQFGIKKVTKDKMEWLKSNDVVASSRYRKKRIYVKLIKKSSKRGEVTSQHS